MLVLKISFSRNRLSKAARRFR